MTWRLAKLFKKEQDIFAEMISCVVTRRNLLELLLTSCQEPQSFPHRVFFFFVAEAWGLFAGMDDQFPVQYTGEERRGKLAQCSAFEGRLGKNMQT